MGKIINDVYVDWIEKVKVLQKAAIVNDHGLILALKRSADCPRPQPGCWDLPGGSVDQKDIDSWKINSGKGNDDDILIRALRREIKEETALDIENICVIHSASSFNETKQTLIVALGYACRAKKENNVKLSSEHSEFKWMAKKDFPDLEIGNDGGLIGSILEKY
jgi:8-oxo-dGTP pyrophosphatase MutT (NUDIX family)